MIITQTKAPGRARSLDLEMPRSQQHPTRSKKRSWLRPIRIGRSTPIDLLIPSLYLELSPAVLQVRGLVSSRHLIDIMIKK